MAARTAFNRQAPLFDELYAEDGIVAYKRKRVREHLKKWLRGNSAILELNAGTGEDALWLASQGHNVHATDISEGMQARLKEKIKQAAKEDQVSSEICSFEELDKLKNRGPYDALFSNFAGLNCTNKLNEVLKSFSPLLKQGGTVTLVILPDFCLWETLLIFRGKFRTAFRRFSGKNGSRAHIEGQYFKCWYYSPGYVKKHVPQDLDYLEHEGLCSLVPPSYLQHADKKYPRAFNFLARLENKWKQKWPWRSIGDYYIISFRKK